MKIEFYEDPSWWGYEHRVYELYIHGYGSSYNYVIFEKDYKFYIDVNHIKGLATIIGHEDAQHLCIWNFLNHNVQDS